MRRRSGCLPATQGQTSPKATTQRLRANPWGNHDDLQDDPLPAPAGRGKLPSSFSHSSSSQAQSMAPPGLLPMSRALVVDDCPDTTDSFCWLLRLWGYDARAANDGPAALALAAEFRPDVALVDLAMPGMDGREVARRLRRLPGLRRLLIVGITGYAGGGRRPCPEGDFDLCLLKPVEPDELRRLLDGLAAAPEARAPLGVKGR